MCFSNGAFGDWDKPTIDAPQPKCTTAFTMMSSAPTAPNGCLGIDTFNMHNCLAHALFWVVPPTSLIRGSCRGAEVWASPLPHFSTTAQPSRFGARTRCSTPLALSLSSSWCYLPSCDLQGPMTKHCSTTD